MLGTIQRFAKSRFFGLFCAFASGCFRAAICYLTHFMRDGNGFKVNLYTCILGLMYVKMWLLLSPKLDQIPQLLTNWKAWLLSGIMGSLSYTAAFQMFKYAPTSDSYSIFLGAELIAGIGVDYFILKKVIGRQAIVSVPLAIVGILLVGQPYFLFGTDDQLLATDYPDHTLGCLVSVVGGVGVVLWWGVCGTSLQNTHTSFIIFAYAVFSILIGSAVMELWNITWCYVHLADRVICVCLSFCDIMNIVTALNAISLESIYVTSIVRTAFLAAFFVADETLLNEPFNWASVLGGVSIFVSVGAEAIHKIAFGAKRLVAAASSSSADSERQPLIEEKADCSLD